MAKVLKYVYLRENYHDKMVLKGADMDTIITTFMFALQQLQSLS